MQIMRQYKKIMDLTTNETIILYVKDKLKKRKNENKR